ncbi:MAG TPA: peptide chain release factor N(5)-glutamine methyltransferase [Acidobacteriota bacterium]|nr:peptide chain release factor N(5)-glutamine methyltransferase [Acidobacteriota bacterium]
MIEHLPRYIAEKARVLEQAGIPSGRAEVELILCHVLDVDRLALYLHGAGMLDRPRRERVDEILSRRATRYPLQYILGEAWFYGRRFVVSPAVMVPVPETELLCQRAVAWTRAGRVPQPRILDLGAGSGVIAVTMACEVEHSSVTALDVSPEALSVARRNAGDHGVLERIDFRRSDFFSALEPDERFDLILSNPPYIRYGDYKGLPPEVKADPRIALTAGEDGMDAIRVIVQDAPGHLAANGMIAFEVGYDQAGAVAALTENDGRYKSIDIMKDLNDIDRVVILSCDG